jgi:hypothetical protein
MKNEFSKSHIVNSYEIDSNRKLRLDNLFMLMQDVATTAANILNVGKDDLDKRFIIGSTETINIESVMVNGELLIHKHKLLLNLNKAALNEKTEEMLKRLMHN